MTQVYHIGHAGHAQQEERVPYPVEDDLEQMIIRNPQMITGGDRADVEVIGSQIHLNGGSLRIDVLLLERTGDLTVVEAKLARNGESRREIFAQAMDYASALAEFRLDDLDAALGGRISLALDRLCPDDNELLDQLEATTALKLRSGDVKVHLALDEEVRDLSRIVNYARRRGLSIGYTWFPRTANGTDGFTVIPQSPYDPSESTASLVSRVTNPSGIRHPQLHAAVAAFNALTGISDRFPTPSIATRYKETYVAKYPKSAGVVHYEFLVETGAQLICAELHVETPRGVPLTPQQSLVRGSFPAIVSAIGPHLGARGVAVEADYRWSNGAGGRVRCTAPIDTDPTVIAKAMQILIANS
jgi:hypothetical protein